MGKDQLHKDEHKNEDFKLVLYIYIYRLRATRGDFIFAKNLYLARNKQPQQVIDVIGPIANNFSVFSVAGSPGF